MVGEHIDQSSWIQATETSFRIVEEIRRRNSAGVSELARALDISKSTAHEHLTTLRELGYVEQVDDEYRLGLKFLTLGGKARQDEKIYRVAANEVVDLARKTGKRAKLVVEKGGKGIYLCQALGGQSIRTDTHAGTTVYLHTTAAGKALLAHLPSDRVDEVIEAGLPAMTDNTITDPDALRSQLQLIRERGIAFDDEERMEGIRCIAAPVTRDGELFGAISVSGSKTKLDDDRFRETLPEAVSDTARVVAIRCSYS